MEWDTGLKHRSTSCILRFSAEGWKDSLASPDVLCPGWEFEFLSVIKVLSYGISTVGIVLVTLVQ